MAESTPSVEIPRRALFKASEVCELMQVQQYVLRSWEAEFPNMGISKAGGPRVYRRADVEQVARIKHLLLVEGLTLAGARRRIEEEGAPVAVNVPVIDELIGQNTRERLTEVKRGLRSILDLLSRADVGQERIQFAAPRPPARQAAPPPPSRTKSHAAHAAPRGKARGKTNSSRRKRSA